MVIDFPKTTEEWFALSRIEPLTEITVGGRHFQVGEMLAEDAEALNEAGTELGTGKANSENLIHREPLFAVKALLRGGDPSFDEWEWVRPRVTTEIFERCQREHLRQAAVKAFSASASAGRA